ncbi:MAG TPA: hypothetical protein VLQ68_00325 [Rhizobiaceae bacterium]|nr:hypothetical protein [Rhizobiaceae bacterium]
MNDTLLYRRFMVVAALIAAIGAMTANVILETRAADSSAANRFSVPGERQLCAGGRMCLATFAKAPFA